MSKQNSHLQGLSHSFTSKGLKGLALWMCVCVCVCVCFIGAVVYILAHVISFYPESNLIGPINAEFLVMGLNYA